MLLFLFKLLAATFQGEEGANACEDDGEQYGEEAVAFGTGAGEDKLAQVAEEDAGNEGENHGFAPEGKGEGTHTQGAEE